MALRMTLAASPARPLTIAAAETALCFQMSDHRLDGGAPRELAFDAAEDPAFLA